MLIQSAAEGLKQCKASLEKVMHHNTPPPAPILAELQSMLKVAITNSVKIELYNRSNNESPSKISFDFSLSKLYPVITIAK